MSAIDQWKGMYTVIKKKLSDNCFYKFKCMICQKKNHTTKV